MADRTIIITDDTVKLEGCSIATDIILEHTPDIDKKLVARYVNNLKKAYISILNCMGVKVIFNNNCTIVCDKTAKAVCKCRDEQFDEEKGLYIALLKLKGYTYSRLKRDLERIGCVSDKAEKAYAYAILTSKYYYPDMLTAMLENAVRQNKKEVK